MDDEKRDLKLAFGQLQAKRSAYGRLFDYYEGEQPLIYTATRLKEIFQELDAYFAENWCSVVVDSARDRINLRQIQIDDKTAAEKWAVLSEASELLLESDDVHEAAMVAGEGYVICWPNDEDMMEMYVNDPRMCHLVYDSEYPRRKRFGAKQFKAQDGSMRMTLYYPDRLEYYGSEKKFEDVSEITSLKEIEEPAKNKYEEVPIFHFRCARKIRSDLKNVVPIQNGINKLLTDMMVAAEFAAFPQRYVISQAEINGKLKNSPSQIWDLPAGDGAGQQTQAGQFDAAELGNYLNAIDNLATAISSITRTPKHYFFSVGSNLSGEALVTMESPLNKKARDRIDRFTPTWKQVVLFMLRGSGITLDPSKVTPIFDRPETLQPKTQAETREINKRAGMPLKSILREEGKSEAEIAQVMADLEEEKIRDAELAQAYLREARKKFDGGGA